MDSPLQRSMVLQCRRWEALAVISSRQIDGKLGQRFQVTSLSCPTEVAGELVRIYWNRLDPTSPLSKIRDIFPMAVAPLFPTLGELILEDRSECWVIRLCDERDKLGVIHGLPPASSCDNHRLAEGGAEC